MVTRPLRQLHPLTAAAVTVLLLTGCAVDLGSIARGECIDPTALVRLSDTFEVAAHRTPSGVQVVAFLREADGRWAPQVIASGARGDVTAHLVSAGGETGDEWNSFLYGTAPDSARRVTLAGFQAAGGQVTDGAWVLALLEKDVHPDQLRWSVIDALGATMESGIGITP